VRVIQQSGSIVE